MTLSLAGLFLAFSLDLASSGEGNSRKSRLKSLVVYHQSSQETRVFSEHEHARLWNYAHSSLKICSLWKVRRNFSKSCMRTWVSMVGRFCFQGQLRHLTQLWGLQGCIKASWTDNEPCWFRCTVYFWKALNSGYSIILILQSIFAIKLEFENMLMSMLTNKPARDQGCQMAKFDPFLFFSLDCAGLEVGVQSKRKGSNFAA